MTVEQAKHELQKERAALNAIRKRIDKLKAFIKANGGELDKKDNSDRNFRIWRDKEAGKTVRELSIIYNLTEESIRRIYDRQARKS